MTTEPVIERSTLLVPAELCYWAVLELPARRARIEALHYAFEPWLPAPLEDIESRFVSHGSWAIACGVDRVRLEAWLAEREGAGRGIESARPATVPDAALQRLGGDVDGQSVAAGLEFRSGAFESPRRRARLFRNASLVAMTLAAVATIDAAGSMFIAREAQSRAVLAERDGMRLANAAIGNAAPGVDSRLVLGAELRQLRRTRDRAVEDLLAEDRTQAFVALLAAWPAETPTAVDRVDIEQSTVSVRGRVRDAAAFERLRLSLRGFEPGWSEQAGDVAREREGASFSVVFGRDASASRGSP